MVWTYLDGFGFYLVWFVGLVWIGFEMLLCTVLYCTVRIHKKMGIILNIYEF